jgi:hypothetical protein
MCVASSDKTNMRSDVQVEIFHEINSLLEYYIMSGFQMGHVESHDKSNTQLSLMSNKLSQIKKGVSLECSDAIKQHYKQGQEHIK